MDAKIAHHRTVAEKVVNDMVTPIMSGGGKTVDVVFLLETVIIGTLATLAELDGHKQCSRYVAAMMSALGETVVNRAAMLDAEIEERAAA